MATLLTQAYETKNAMTPAVSNLRSMTTRELILCQTFDEPAICVWRREREREREREKRASAWAESLSARYISNSNKLSNQTHTRTHVHYKRYFNNGGCSHKTTAPHPRNTTNKQQQKNGCSVDDVTVDRRPSN